MSIKRDKYRRRSRYAESGKSSQSRSKCRETGGTGNGGYGKLSVPQAQASIPEAQGAVTALLASAGNVPWSLRRTRAAQAAPTALHTSVQAAPLTPARAASKTLCPSEARCAAAKTSCPSGARQPALMPRHQRLRQTCSRYPSRPGKSAQKNKGWEWEAGNLTPCKVRSSRCSCNVR